MPSYRGVEKAELLASIRQTIAFIKNLGLGPKTDRAVDVLLNQEKIDKIAAARDDAALSSAMKETDVAFAMTLFARLLRFHAVTDEPVAGARSEALDLYTRLSAWGAFKPDQSPIDVPWDAEVSGHLLAASAAILDGEEENLSGDVNKRFKEFLSDLNEMESSQGDPEAKGQGEMSKWLASSVPLILSLSRLGGCESDIKQVLHDNPEGAAIMPQALEAMLDIEKREAGLNIFAPIRPYRIALGPSPESRENMEAVIKPVMQKIKDLMLPFIKKDEMVMKIIAVSSIKTQEAGLIIFGSRQAIQLLADNLENQIFDSQGVRVVPRLPPGPSPARGPSPSL